MQDFSFQKFFSFLLFVVLANDTFCQTGSAGPATISNSRANAITLNATPATNRRFIANSSGTTNPFKSNIKFSTNSTGTENITYALISSEGKQLRITSQKLSRGSNVFFINDLEPLQPGVYFLQVRKDDLVKTIKLLKTDR